MSPTWVTFGFEAANLLALAGVLGWVFFRPVRDAIESRRAALEAEQRQIAEQRANAEREREAASALRRELEDSLGALRERGRQEAEQERERVVAAAREQAQRERDALKAELCELRRAESRSLARDTAAAAREITVRLLARIGGIELESALLRSAARELTALAKVGPLAPVIVESVYPLEPGRCAELAHAARLETAELGVRVVPELVAGVRILTARGLIDASASGLGAQAERALVARIEAEETASRG